MHNVTKDGVTYTPKEWCNKMNERFKKFPYKATYTKLVRSAKRRNKGIDLTYEEFLTFTKIDTCHYCCKKVKWVKHGPTSRTNLDRKDNSKGYSLDNCVVSCWDCNNGRSNIFSYKDWYAMTKYLRDLAEIRVNKLFDLHNND